MGIFKNTYAFDDSSILKLCKIRIPDSYQIFFKESILTAKNYSKLKTFIDKLSEHNIPKFRFVPAENMEQNTIKVANQLLEGYSIQMLKNVFKVEIMDQLTGFNERIKDEFNEIQKDDDIEKIKQIFVSNPRKLSKDEDIPQDDDLKIIAGYNKYGCEGGKYLISEDEHFWGYTDLILNNFNIRVVKEWECHLIAV